MSKVSCSNAVDLEENLYYCELLLFLDQTPMLLGQWVRQFKEKTQRPQRAYLSILCWLLYVSRILTSNQPLWPFRSHGKSRCIPLSKYLSDRSIYIFPAMLKFLIQRGPSLLAWPLSIKNVGSYRFEMVQYLPMPICKNTLDFYSFSNVWF